MRDAAIELKIGDVKIRPAIPADVPAIFSLICALAEYEHLAHEVVGSAEALHHHLFGESPCIQTIVAETAGKAVGFALFFLNYSTFLTRPGIYLEDLFVLPEYRGQRIGKSLLIYLAQLAQTENYGRLEWSVLDWNTPAIEFYQRIGAKLIEDVRTCRITDSELTRLAAMPTMDLRVGLPSDASQIFALVKANIEYDGNLHLFQGTEAALIDHLFNRGYAETIVATHADQIIGIALVFTTYSTFLTKPGLYIEDLFVLPEFRSQGTGTMLLAHLAQQVIDRNYGRLEWRVRPWNQKAIEFYQRIGATILPDWRVCRMEDTAIARLAASASVEQAN